MHSLWQGDVRHEKLIITVLMFFVISKKKLKTGVFVWILTQICLAL